MNALRWLVGVPVAVLGACGSKDPGGPVVLHVDVSGQVSDYFAGTAVVGAVVAEDGAPAVVDTSTAGGAYAVQVSSTDSLVLITTKLAFRATRNAARAATSGPVDVDLSIVASADAQRQYTSIGATETSGTGMVFVELVDGAGAPRTGIPAADIALVDASMSPVGVGPYFFGAAGDIVENTTLSQSTAFGGRARAAFVNVPPGVATIRLALVGQTLTAPIAVSAGGVTLVER